MSCTVIVSSAGSGSHGGKQAVKTSAEIMAMDNPATQPLSPSTHARVYERRFVLGCTSEVLATSIGPSAPPTPPLPPPPPPPIGASLRCSPASLSRGRVADLERRTEASAPGCYLFTPAHVSLLPVSPKLPRKIGHHPLRAPRRATQLPHPSPFAEHTNKIQPLNMNMRRRESLGPSHVCHHCCSGLPSRAGGESPSRSAGALQHGHVGASQLLSHLRMHAR